MNESYTTEQSASFEDQLARLKSVLDTEHQALLAGDAKTVASLAVEKEHLAEALAAQRPELPASDSLSREIKQLAKQVDDLAKLNHVLLKEVYQYYHGMLELFMRLGGRGQTYGRNGILSVDTLPKKEREILA